MARKRSFSINFTKKQRAMRAIMRANPPKDPMQMANYTLLRLKYKQLKPSDDMFVEYATIMARNKYAREYLDTHPYLAREISEMGIDNFIKTYNPDKKQTLDNSDDKLVFAREFYYYSELNIAMFNAEHFL